jgi:hypothetical protein
MAQSSRPRSIRLFAIACVACAGSDCSARQASDDPVGSVEQALSASVAGFVWAQDTTGDFDPYPQYSYNSSGGVNHIQQLDTGLYDVHFLGLGHGAGVGWGNAQVTAYGFGTERCNLASEVETPDEVTVRVQCRDLLGNPADTQFTVAYERRPDTPWIGMEGGYVYADSMAPPPPGTWTPISFLQWDSIGGTVTIDHNAPGDYLVTFPGQDFHGGTVQVTAGDVGYGDPAVFGPFCKATSWWVANANQYVYVNCYSPGSDAGPMVDAPFWLTFSRRSPNNIPTYTYAWANQPTADSYTPDLTYQHGMVHSECGDTPTSAPVTISRWSAGYYTVAFPDMGPSGRSFPTNVQVSGYGFDMNTCKVSGWSGGGTTVYAGVFCFDATGAPADAYFTIAFSSIQALVC